MARPLVRLRRLVREGRSDAPGHVVDVLGRIGLIGYGVVHLVVAWLVPPAGSPPHTSTAQVPAGRTGEPPEYADTRDD